MATSAQQGLDEIKVAMARTTALFSREVFQNRNFDALDEIYTRDAQILPPGSPAISGRAAIREFWANLIPGMNATAAELQTVEVIPAGDAVLEIGRASLTLQTDGQGTTDVEIKYLVYWREEDGSWKWHIDIWNQSS